jgi:hypothetical protein
MRNRPLIAAAVALLLAALACGPLADSTDQVFEEIEAELEEGTTDGETAADGGETAQEDTAEEPPASAEDAPPFEYTGLDYESFDSYAIDMVINFTATDGSANLDLQISVAEQVEPPVSEFVMEVSGSGGGEAFDLGLEGESGRIGLYEVDGVSYVEFSEEQGEPFCIGSPADPEEDTEAPVEDFIGEGGAFDLSEVDATFEIIEAGVEVNGVQTYHYRATDFQDADMTEAVADVYVSQESGEIIRLVVDGVGTLDDEVGEGNVVLSYDVVSINEPITVEVPDYCETFDIPEDGGEEGTTDS